jgi:ribosomal-protein-alanine acetyltransferase
MNNTEINIRPMEPADVPIVSAIEQQAFPHPWGEQAFYDCIRVNFKCWVLEIPCSFRANESTVGINSMSSLTESEVDINSICSPTESEVDIKSICSPPPRSGGGDGGEGAVREIVGYAIVMTALDESQLLNIAIAPTHRGKKLGKYLLSWILAQLKATGTKEMFLEVRVSNMTAIHFYETLGFEKIGIRKGYYPLDNGREDAVLYKLEQL